MRFRAAAVAACTLLLVVALVSVQDGHQKELLAGPVPNIHIPTASTVVRSAMPSSWLSRGDEKSSPLLQDSSDNALQVMGTPGAAALHQPARGISLAERTSAAAPARALPVFTPQAATSSVHHPEAAAAPAAASGKSATPSAGGSGNNKLAAEAKALSGQLSALPKVPDVSRSEAAKGKAQAAEQVAPTKATAQDLNQWHKAPTGDRWKSMVKSAEEAAEKLAQEHPRSVLGSHWRSDVAAPTETLTEDSAAANRAGKAAAQQQIRLAEDHLKQKGIYAPAAMCEKDHLPCPGKLQVQETSTGHYAPVRDNGPLPGQTPKTANDAGKRSIRAPARYPGVSFYAKMREELSDAGGKTRLSSGRPHKTSLEMLAPGKHVRRPSREVEEHRREEERRDDQKRREEDELRRQAKGRQSEDRGQALHHGGRDDKEGDGVRRRDLGRSINDHLYRLFSARSDKSRRGVRDGQPDAEQEQSRDSIRAVEGSKLYQEELDGDDDDDDGREEEREERRFPPSEYPPRASPREAERRAAEEEGRKRMEGERRIKEAQERMAERWRQMQANPPRRTRATRPDMLDPRELLVPRTGFEAKKKELHAFKNAIEMYEADPEMNPISVVQAHKLEKYGIMPPESDQPRVWQAWYRMVTDKARILSDQVAMLAEPVLDAKHRWDHGSPGDGEQGAVRRVAPPPPPAPDRLERSIEGRMAKEVISAEDIGGREPTEVTVSEAPQDAPAEYRDDSGRGYRELPSLRARDRGYMRAPQRDRDEYVEERDGGYIGQQQMQREGDYRREGVRDDGRAGRENEEERPRYQRAYEEQGPRHEYFTRSEPVGRLYGKVDRLEDEVGHLVKILSRRQQRLAGEDSGREERRGEDSEARDEVRAESPPPRRRVEAHDNSHAEKARLAARHVVDWLKGAMLAAKL